MHAVHEAIIHDHLIITQHKTIYALRRSDRLKSHSAAVLPSVTRPLKRQKLDDGSRAPLSPGTRLRTRARPSSSSSSSSPRPPSPRSSSPHRLKGSPAHVKEAPPTIRLPRPTTESPSRRLESRAPPAPIPIPTPRRTRLHFSTSPIPAKPNRYSSQPERPERPETQPCPSTDSVSPSTSTVALPPSQDPLFTLTPTPHVCQPPLHSEPLRFSSDPDALPLLYPPPLSYPPGRLRSPLLNELRDDADVTGAPPIPLQSSPIPQTTSDLRIPSSNSGFYPPRCPRSPSPGHPNGQFGTRIPSRGLWKLACCERVDYFMRMYGAEAIRDLIKWQAKVGQISIPSSSFVPSIAAVSAPTTAPTPTTWHVLQTPDSYTQTLHDMGMDVRAELDDDDGEDDEDEDDEDEDDEDDENGSNPRSDGATTSSEDASLDLNGCNFALSFGAAFEAGGTLEDIGLVAKSSWGPRLGPGVLLPRLLNIPVPCIGEIRDRDRRGVTFLGRGTPVSWSRRVEWAGLGPHAPALGADVAAGPIVKPAAGLVSAGQRHAALAVNMGSPCSSSSSSSSSPSSMLLVSAVSSTAFEEAQSGVAQQGQRQSDWGEFWGGLVIGDDPDAGGAWWGIGRTASFGSADMPRGGPFLTEVVPMQVDGGVGAGVGVGGTRVVTSALSSALG